MVLWWKDSCSSFFGLYLSTHNDILGQVVFRTLLGCEVNFFTSTRGIRAAMCTLLHGDVDYERTKQETAQRFYNDLSVITSIVRDGISCRNLYVSS